MAKLLLMLLLVVKRLGVCLGTMGEQQVTRSGSHPEINYNRRIAHLVEKYHVRVPVRSFMHDQNYTWRFGKMPDYSMDNYYYLKEKTMNHTEGSLEQIVEDLVKTWEFERSHKLLLKQHKAIDQSSPTSFQMCANGKKRFMSKEAHDAGNYNVLLNGVDPTLYPQNLTWMESYELFENAWKVFPWELLQVFSNPPSVAFSWRHWSKFTGTFRGHEGDHRFQELYGYGVAVVNNDLKLQDIEIYYKPEDFLRALMGEEDPRKAYFARTVMGPMCALLKEENPPNCPFHRGEGVMRDDEHAFV